MNIILKKARKDFKNLGWRSYLMIFVIAFSLGGALALQYAIDAASPMIDDIFDDANHADYKYQLGETSWITQSQLNDLDDIEEVRDYTGRLFWETSIKLKGDEDRKYLILIGLHESIDKPEVYGYTIESGDNFNEGDIENGAVIDETFAERNDIDVGDEIKITGLNDAKIKITGTMNSPEFMALSSNPEIAFPIEGSAGVLYLSKDVLKQFITDYLTWYNSYTAEDLTPLIFYYGTVDYNNIAIKYNDGEAEEGHDNVKSYLENDCSLVISDSEQFEESYAYSNLRDNINQSKEFMFIILFFMIFMGVLIVFVIFNRYVLAQKQQLGVIEAIGYERKDLLKYFLFNIMVIGCVAIPIGIFVGYYIGYTIVGQLLSEMARIPLENLDFIFLPHIMYLGIGIGIGMIVLSTFLPIRKIRKKEISDLIYKQTDIDYKINSKKHLKKKKIKEKDNVSGILVLHNTFKNKRRLMLTVGAITCSLLIVSAGQTILDSIFFNIDRTFTKNDATDTPSESWDLNVQFQNPINRDYNESYLNSIRDMDGVNSVEIYTKGMVSVHDRENEENFLIFGMDWKDTKMHNFIWKDASNDNSVPEKDDEIVISSVLSAKFDLEIGDKIEIKNAEGNETEFNIVGIHQELVTCSYISEAAGRQLFHSNANYTDGLYLLLDEDAEKGEIKDEIYDMVNIDLILDREEMGENMEEFIMNYFIIFQIIVYYTLFVAFFIILYNSVMNIYDKNYEYGILRSLGFSKRKNFLYIISENILQGVIPIVLALIFTTPLANYIASIYEDQFPIVVYIGIPALFMVTIPPLLLFCAGSIIGLRTVYKQNLYEQVQTSFVG